MWMENEPKVLNKGYLVGKLRERGLSRRAAVRILDAVLDEVAAALGRGEAVEFPFGCLKRVRHAHKEQRGRFLGKIAIIYKRPYTVALEVDADGEKLLNMTKKKRGLVKLPPRPKLASGRSLLDLLN